MNEKFPIEAARAKALEIAEALRPHCERIEIAGSIRRGKPWVADKLMPVDIYMATEESWATLLLIRTGSAEHNIWMCARARACGGKLHADGSGLEVPGQYDSNSGFAS